MLSCHSAIVMTDAHAQAAPVPTANITSSAVRHDERRSLNERNLIMLTIKNDRMTFGYTSTVKLAMLHLRPWKRGLFGVALLAEAAIGCGTVMSETHLTPSLTKQQADVQVRIERVDLDRSLRYRDFARDSRIVVQLDVLALRDTRLDLRRARMAIAGGPLGEHPRLAIASGPGEPPQRLIDSAQLEPVQLHAGEHARFWVAFGQFEPRRSREIPERVSVQLSGAEPMTISEPGNEPLWKGEPPRATFGTGIWAQASADEGSLNWMIGDLRAALGPLVLGARYGVGVRDPQSPSGKGQTLVGVNIPLAIDLSWPVLKTRDVILSPYIGAEAALLVGNDTVRRRTWFGPAIGLDVALRPLTPQHGPFPVDYPRSVLGSENIQLALVHWFGPDRSPPSLGVTMSVSMGWGN